VKTKKNAKWRVTSTLINNKKMYGVYRILNEKEVDHDGNRHTYKFYDSEEEAIAIVDELNELEEDD